MTSNNENTGSMRVVCADCGHEHQKEFMIGVYCAGCELKAVRAARAVIASQRVPDCERAGCRIVGLWVDKSGITACSHHVDTSDIKRRWHLLSPSLLVNIGQCVDCHNPFKLADLSAGMRCFSCYVASDEAFTEKVKK